MLKLSTAVLSGILAISFSQLAAAQASTANSPNNPAATGVEKDQTRHHNRANTRLERRSSAGTTAPNRRSPNNPAATPDIRKDDSQMGTSTGNAAGGATANRSSPNNPAAAPDLPRKQEQR